MIDARAEHTATHGAGSRERVTCTRIVVGRPARSLGTGVQPAVIADSPVTPASCAIGFVIAMQNPVRATSGADDRATTRAALGTAETPTPGANSRQAGAQAPESQTWMPPFRMGGGPWRSAATAESTAPSPGRQEPIHEPSPLPTAAPGLASPGARVGRAGPLHRAARGPRNPYPR